MRVTKRLMAALLACLMLVSLLPVRVYAADAGKIALLAVTQDGYVIEPEYMTYHDGDTVKDVLKGSGHTFAGIDSGFITAVDGHVDNYSLHYDGDGYQLDAPAKGLTAIWFTTNASQSYGSSLLNLAERMAAYRTATNGVQNYAAAKAAYDAAHSAFYAATDGKAAPLLSELKLRMEKFEAFQKGDKVTVSVSATQDDAAVTPAVATFTSEFGTVTTVKNAASVQLVPATYAFDLSDGGIHHVRGTVEVTAQGAAVSAPLPTGKWIKSVRLGIDNQWKDGQDVPKFDETDDGATFWVPDYAYANLMPYFERGEGIGTGEGQKNVRVYLAGKPTTGANARVWESKSTSLTGVIEHNSLTPADVVVEARYAVGDYEQYQPYTMHILRTSSLSDLTVFDASAPMKLDFDKKTPEYSVVTTEDSVNISAATLCAETVMTVAGKKAQSGVTVNVPLASCQKNADGKYVVPIVLTYDGRVVTYTVLVEKRDSVSVTLTHDNDVTVELTNNAGAVLTSKQTNAGSTVYSLIPGESYTYVSTKQGYYHTTAAVKAAAGLTVAVPTPIAADWLSGLAAQSTMNSKTAVPYPMTPAFATGVHEYTFDVESNSSNFFLNRVRTDKSYVTTAVYYGHFNSNFHATHYEKALTSQDTGYGSLANFMAAGGYGNTMELKVAQAKAVNGVTFYQSYILSAKRTMTLNSMSLTDNNNSAIALEQKDDDSKGFDKLVLDYTTSLGQRVPEMRLTMRPLSGYRNDADMTVTVACGDWSQVITYDADHKPNAQQTVAIPLNTALLQETVTVTVSHKDPTSAAQTYTIQVNKLPPVETAITTDPADATVFLTSNVSSQRILPGAAGVYTLDTNGAYTLVVTRSGYVGQKIDLVAGEANKNITVKLEKAPDNTHKDILQPGDWPLFRADSNNNGVVKAATPIRAEDAVLVWANQTGEGYGSSAVSSPIIVGGYLYAYARNQIMKFDKDTGAVVASGTMVASSSFAINSPTYADGMIFVGLSNGRVQAFDAETLDSLWVYTDPLGGQPNCPIAYCDGYIYTGFWNSETKHANFACISVTDEDPENDKEAKLGTWTYTHNGFYWAGAYACSDFILVTTDDGDSGYTTAHGSILSLDPRTGKLLDQLTATGVGDLRSSITYDTATEAYYFTSKGGDLYQVKTNKDGTFADGSLKRLHLDNGSSNDQTPPMSTSTPVIHNGRAYIGVSGTSQFGAYSGHNITVVDLASFSIAYSVPTQGYPQTSGLLTSAYESQDGYAYVYFFDNFTPGKLRVLRDKPGMTEVDHTYTTMETYSKDGQDVTIETPYVLFTPSGDQAQYAICSPISDSEGNIYFKNDSAYMMRLSSRMTALEITRQPDRTTYEIGEKFDNTGMQVTARFANGVTKDVTKYVRFTTEALTAQDTEITVSFDITKVAIPGEDGSPNWKFYQNRDGQAGQDYLFPTGTVNIRLTDGHVYGEPVWTWNEDFTAYADFFCTVNPAHEKLHMEATVTSQVTTGSSCTQGGVRTYTAAVVRDGVTYTDTRTQAIPAAGHQLTAVAEVPAACEATGVRAHWRCSVCGKLFADAQGTEETTLEALTIPAAGHDTQLVGAKDATCTEDGYTGDEVCKTCGVTVKQGETIPATGHDTEIVGAKPATCTQDGYTGDEFCKICGVTVKKGDVIPATGHDTQLVGAKAATCTEDGYTGDEVCKTCGVTVKQGETIPATGHDTEIVGAKDATCTEDGYTGDEVCKICGETVKKGETIPATGHDTEIVGAKDATCTEDGYTGDEVCKTCGVTVKQGETIPAMGHDYKDGKCTVCGAADPDYRPEQPENPGVKTGDSGVLLYMGLMMVCALGSCLTLRRRKAR